MPSTEADRLRELMSRLAEQWAHLPGDAEVAIADENGALIRPLTDEERTRELFDRLTRGTRGSGAPGSRGRVPPLR